jgi:phenylacetate-CoA ligase
MTTTRMFNPAIEQLDRERLLDLQWQKLAYQLDYLHRTNPFYREAMEEAGAKPPDITSIEAFRERVPFCDKPALLEDQNRRPPYGDRLGADPLDVRMLYMTSGTSGVGQEVYGHTWADALGSGTKCLEGPFWWMGLTKGDRVFIMVPIASLAFGLMSVETARLGGYVTFPAFNLDSGAKLAAMKRFSVSTIMATPTHVARLTTVARELGIDPQADFPDLKGIFVAGQAYPVELAQRLEEVWGTKLYETYGSSQGNGFTASTCEHGAVRADGERGAMHVFEHRAILEVLDPDTWAPVAPGEEGMAVITNLDVEGSPLLRFRTNDKVRYLGHDCPCGRPWSMIEAGTISRYDDMLKIRGMNIWPSVVDDTVLGRDEVDEYLAEVYVDDANNEQVNLTFALSETAAAAMAPEARERLRAELVDELKRKTNVTFQLREVPRAELPVFEFKAIRWRDARQQDLVKKVW